jgi:hypothetical protein
MAIINFLNNTYAYLKKNYELNGGFEDHIFGLS